MGFQILNNQGEPIPIKELDKEAAAFWGQTVDEKYYAEPKGGFFMNWFDHIGREISDKSSNWTTGWDNVKCGLMSNSLVSIALEEDKHKKLDSVIDFNKPYFELIDHWSSLGYTPRRTTD